MKQRTPFGFWVAGAFSGWFAGAMVVVALSLEPWDGDWAAVGFRAAAAFLAVLAAVVTEALWRVRPWVWRASLALALSYGVITFLVLTAEPGSRLGDTIAILMVSAVVIVPLLAYIHGRAREIWPPQGWQRSSKRVQVPRPPPPIPPPQHTGWPP